LLENDPSCYERMGNYLMQIGQSLVDTAKSVGIPMVAQGVPGVLVFHSQGTQLIKAEGYDESTKLRDILITRISRNYGIQFSPVSRFFSNLLMDDSDVSFFKERIGEVMADVARINELL
jgi:glutamate-1-semialdehyde 2,1-aminomutase